MNLDDSVVKRVSSWLALILVNAAVVICLVILGALAIKVVRWAVAP